MLKTSLNLLESVRGSKQQYIQHQDSPLTNSFVVFLAARVQLSSYSSFQMSIAMSIFWLSKSMHAVHVQTYHTQDHGGIYTSQKHTIVFKNMQEVIICAKLK